MLDDATACSARNVLLCIVCWDEPGPSWTAFRLTCQPHHEYAWGCRLAVRLRRQGCQDSAAGVRQPQGGGCSLCLSAGMRELLPLPSSAGELYSIRCGRQSHSRSSACSQGSQIMPRA